MLNQTDDHGGVSLTLSYFDESEKEYDPWIAPDYDYIHQNQPRNLSSSMGSKRVIGMHALEMEYILVHYFIYYNYHEQEEVNQRSLMKMKTIVLLKLVSNELSVCTRNEIRSLVY